MDAYFLSIDMDTTLPSICVDPLGQTALVRQSRQLPQVVIRPCSR